jgi:hypothetical protein
MRRAFVDKKLSENSEIAWRLHYRVIEARENPTFQSLYVVTRGIHFANPCFSRQFYSGHSACRRPLPHRFAPLTGEEMGHETASRSGTMHAIRELYLEFLAIPHESPWCTRAARRPPAGRFIPLKAPPDGDRTSETSVGCLQCRDIHYGFAWSTCVATFTATTIFSTNTRSIGTFDHRPA